jgi:hypothetical protein
MHAKSVGLDDAWGKRMSATDVAKVVWRWGGLARQAAEDYRCHKRHRDLPTSLLHRFLEQERLLWSNRIRASDYYALGLSDPGMPWTAKRDYVGGYQSWRLYVPMNPIQFQEVTDKKLKFNAKAAEVGLPVASILAIVSREPGGGRHPVLRSEQELRAWLLDNTASDIVIKPVDGTKGWGVISLGARVPGEEAWVRLPGTESIGFTEVWAHCARYLYRGGVILERRLQPHPVLAAMMPNVLHTVRAISYVKPEPVIIAAALRVGKGNGPADNLARGGIVLPIDLDSGTCGRGSMVVEGLPRMVDEHPVTRQRLTGVVLPYWDETCDLVRRAALTFSAQKSLGWDVGVTEDGPVLLEGNSRYDLAVNQIAGRRGILGTPWVEVFNDTGAYRHLSLGFSNRPKIPAPTIGTSGEAGRMAAS